MADGNGVVVISSAVVDSVAEECGARLDREQATFKGLGKGVSRSQLYADLGEF